MLRSRVFSAHYFLSCFTCGSLSCKVVIFLSFMGSVISSSICTGSGCFKLMLPISHLMTSSSTCVVAGGNSFPSSSGCGLSLHPSLLVWKEYLPKCSKFQRCYVLQFQFNCPVVYFRVHSVFSKNFLSGRWSLFTITFAVSM